MTDGEQSATFELRRRDGIEDTICEIKERVMVGCTCHPITQGDCAGVLLTKESQETGRRPPTR